MSERIKTPLENELDADRQKLLKDQFVDTSSLESINDMQKYLANRPNEAVEVVEQPIGRHSTANTEAFVEEGTAHLGGDKLYGKHAKEEQVNPLDQGIFEHDVFYDAENERVFAVEAASEVNGEKVYIISTTSSNGAEKKEIMTAGQVREYLDGIELADPGYDRQRVERGELDTSDYQLPVQSSENTSEEATSAEQDDNLSDDTEADDQDGESNKEGDSATGEKADSAKAEANKTLGERALDAYGQSKAEFDAKKDTPESKDIPEADPQAAYDQAKAAREKVEKEAETSEKADDKKEDDKEAPVPVAERPDYSAIDAAREAVSSQAAGLAGGRHRKQGRGGPIKRFKAWRERRKERKAARKQMVADTYGTHITNGEIDAQLIQQHLDAMSHPDTFSNRLRYIVGFETKAGKNKDRAARAEQTPFQTPIDNSNIQSPADVKKTEVIKTDDATEERAA